MRNNPIPTESRFLFKRAPNMDEFNQQWQILTLIDFLFIDGQPKESQHSTWHNDLREAHLASHSCRSVH